MKIFYTLESRRHRFLLSLSAEAFGWLEETWPDPFERFYGVPMTDSWEEVDLILEEDLLETLPADWKLILCMDNLIVFSQVGFNQYSELMSSFGEFLPAHFRDEPVYIFHCTNVLDMIDVERSQYELGHICGPVNDMRKIVFRPELSNGSMMFRGGYLPRRLWFTTTRDDAAILQMFLDNQTGIVPRVVSTVPD